MTNPSNLCIIIINNASNYLGTKYRCEFVVCIRSPIRLGENLIIRNVVGFLKFLVDAQLSEVKAPRSVI